MDAPTTVYLKDYRPPAFLVPQVELDIDLLSEDEAVVKALLAVRLNPEVAPGPALVGCTVKPRCVATPCVMLNPLEVAVKLSCESRLRPRTMSSFSPIWVPSLECSRR